MNSLTQSFAAALAANRLLQPANDNAKSYLLALINTDGSSPAVASARQSLGNAYINEVRGAVARNDLAAAETWLNEARAIGFSGEALTTAIADVAAGREKVVQRSAPVGENLPVRIEYVAPKFPSSVRNRGVTGWVELEFTVLEDGSTADVVVTNSSPRRTFDNAAMTAIGQWRYKPVVARDGKIVQQRVAVRIRFSDE
jgi:TonB family protein